MTGRVIGWVLGLMFGLLGIACQQIPPGGVAASSEPVGRAAPEGETWMQAASPTGSTFGSLAIRLVLAVSGEAGVAVRRGVQALAGVIGSVRLQVSGRNVPQGAPPFVVSRSQFAGNQATVTIGNLLPGPIHLDVTLLDAGNLVLGVASGDATISAGISVPLVLAINAATGTASVKIDPAALGEPAPIATPSLSFALRAVPPGTWAPGPPLSIGRAALGAGVVAGRIFAVSGDVNMSVETLDPSEGRWVPVLLPTTKELAITLAGAAGIRNTIVLLGTDAETSGGLFERLGPIYVDPFAAPGGMVRPVPQTTAILPEGDTTFWRAAAGVAAIGDLAYMVGGVSQRIDTTTAPPGNGYVHPTSTEVLDVSRSVWFNRQPIPQAKAGLALAAIGNKLVAAGGYQWTDGPAGLKDIFQSLPYFDAAQATTSVLSTVHVYDAGTDSWTSGPSLAAPRHSAAIAVAGGRVYLLGGADAAGKVVATVESWAIGDPSWKAEPAMPSARALCAAAFAPDGLIAVMGGVDDRGTALRTVELYNPGVVLP
jgi:hypothetical protein